MKRLRLLPLLLITLLAGCEFRFGNETSNSNSVLSTSNSSISNSGSGSASVSGNSTPSTSTSASTSTSSKPSNQTSISTVVPTEPRSLNLYAINDFHGAVIENQTNKEPGIAKLGGYLMERKSEGNTLLLNSGDMWQGAIESNYNYGNLLTDCMNTIGFDCFTLGNHEFDWGAKYISSNRERSMNGYQTPFLASNIYNYDIDTKRTLDFANLGDKYTIRILENGLRVGIIGVIGSKQITSICSQFADDYTFVDPVPVVKTLSDELRSEQNVDVVILDCHTDQVTIGTEVTNISSVTNSRYVDAVFCAHTHTSEYQEVNGVPYIQTNGYGKEISSVELEVAVDGSITCKNYENLSAYEVTASSESTELTNLVNKYKAISDPVGNEVLGNINGYLTSSASLPNLVCKSIASAASAQGFDISYALSNSARAKLDSGDITYGNLYRSLPFDNEIYILEVSGADLIRELGYNSTSMYRIDKTPISSSKKYTIAVIDYMALHRGASRNYDYFPSLVIKGKLTNNGQVYNYRDITADYIRNYSGTLQYWDYADSVDVHDTTKINQAI